MVITVTAKDCIKLDGGTGDLVASGKDLLAKLKKLKVDVESVKLEQAGANVKITVKPETVTKDKVKAALKL